MSENISNLAYMDEHEERNILNGSCYAIAGAKADQKLYNSYKNDQEGDLSEYQLDEMKVLSVLEGLGYPLDELGTYLYKEVVMSAYQNIKGYDRNKDKDKAENLLKELNDGYSNFYRWIARDDLELGVKSFHIFIGRAIDKINPEKIDSNLALKIFGKNPTDSTYGDQAFKIASYLSKKYMIKYDDVKVKKLSNLNEELILKAEGK